MFFDSWSGVGRVALLGALAYLAVVVALRLSGKRTLAKMNAFDLVVTVALGSTLATILLTQQVALLEGVTALAVLVVLQFLVAWLAARSSTVRKAVKSQPSYLLHRGRLLPEALRAHRVTEDEVHQQSVHRASATSTPSTPWSWRPTAASA
ncbi:DUF421 domain-containing protein [Actinophytocola algeriensis]|uniref:Uncharacterized membrane protein YcaP (DUF421 family) n=1 Tax=Actinophytocola algeriensis TaxID=1768010 RepID=A0A7W7QFM3_9PSEU|nr:hypothetical protein [Actinophytocola algeriensis]MBB4912737.1 uncharacterized membrane protein YcaP (DUF421 family) [Actinophytocola algeriensis]MBE1473595.1 uncharacterized membrane protein YcaP (DUF421 family) [Actinophytocola algeriensis]